MYFVCFLLALLPPNPRLRPQSPPPPPPVPPRKQLETESENSKDVKKVLENSVFYENTILAAASLNSVKPEQPTPPKKTGTVNVALILSFECIILNCSHYI